MLNWFYDMINHFNYFLKNNEIIINQIKNRIEI